MLNPDRNCNDLLAPERRKKEKPPGGKKIRNQRMGNLVSIPTLL
jgi:hypothetical protein